MVTTEALRHGALPLQALGPRVAAEALTLSIEPGWNQSAADWELMLARGIGYGCREPGGALVASALALPYGERLGWISMVLVTARWRRRGLASALLERCVTVLEEAGRMPVLDATADGANVYARHGFVPRFGFTRWRGTGGRAGGRAPSTRILESSDRAALLDLDAAVFGADRGWVVDDLVARSRTCAAIAPGGDGFCLSRDGRHARQLGPVSAACEAQAIELLGDALARTRGAVVVDALDERPALGAWLESAGFERVRSFTRMQRGAGLPGDLRRTYAVAGPEFG